MGVQFYDLRIYQKAKELAIMIDRLSFELPRHELYETGSQIRRSSKSVVANIVEGYGRRSYVRELIKFYIYAIASSDETRAHLELLYGTNRIGRETHDTLTNEYTSLSVSIHNAIQAIKRKQGYTTSHNL